MNEDKANLHLLIGLGCVVMWLLYLKNDFQNPDAFAFGFNPLAFRVFALATLPAFILYFLLSYRKLTSIKDKIKHV